MRIDFHSHILPGMDDGARDINESVKLIDMLIDANVDVAALTSHFYRQKEDIPSFLKRREKAFAELSEATEQINGCPTFILGAEVYFYPSLASDPDFYKLCFEGTDYILLELPFEQFHDNFYRNYANFLNKCEQKIILAHIERYLSFGNTVNDLVKLFDYGEVLCQMNCTSVAKADIFKRKTLMNMISGGMINALGTDTHNPVSRPPEFKKAEKIITAKCGAGVFRRLCKTSGMILDNKSISEVLEI